jgi:hypothetical protein
MTQMRLAGTSPKLLKSVAKGYDENNLRTAREILDEPENFGGEGSGLVNWAHTVVEKAEASKCEN